MAAGGLTVQEFPAEDAIMPTVSAHTGSASLPILPISIPIAVMYAHSMAGVTIVSSGEIFFAHLMQ